MSLIGNYARRMQRQPLRKTAKFLLQPKKLFFHASRIVFGRSAQIQNFYVESERGRDIRFCAETLGISEREVDTLRIGRIGRIIYYSANVALTTGGQT